MQNFISNMENCSRLLILTCGNVVLKFLCLGVFWLRSFTFPCTYLVVLRLAHFSVPPLKDFQCSFGVVFSYKLSHLCCYIFVPLFALVRSGFLSFLQCLLLALVSPFFALSFSFSFPIYYSTVFPLFRRL